MRDRTVAQMHEQARRWLHDAKQKQNEGATTTDWYVTPGEYAALFADVGAVPEDSCEGRKFYGMRLKVIRE